jgi:hypothetical protein
MEQLKKITETADADIEQLASIISAHGYRTRKPEWLVPFLVSMGTVISVLLLYQLAHKILIAVQKAHGSVPLSNAEDPATEPLTKAPAGSQGTQDREVEALPCTVYFTTYPHSLS